MKNSTYQAALKCKSIFEEKMGINKTRLIFNSKLYYDFTVRGVADTYLSAIEELCSAIKDDYPAISHELCLHKERYKGDETIIHYTAMNAIVDTPSANRLRAADMGVSLFSERYSL